MKIAFVLPLVFASSVSAEECTEFYRSEIDKRLCECRELKSSSTDRLDCFDRLALERQAMAALGDARLRMFLDTDSGPAAVMRAYEKLKCFEAKDAVKLSELAPAELRTLLNLPCFPE